MRWSELNLGADYGPRIYCRDFGLAETTRRPASAGTADKGLRQILAHELLPEESVWSPVSD
jgi:hypothetical protein